MIRSLLLIAHGSPRPEANAPLRQALADIEKQKVFDHVSIAFLECNEPDIASGLEENISLGAEEIIIVPCFLHPGNHVVNDLPDILERIGRNHPAVRLKLSPFLGSSGRITDILLQRAEEAMDKSEKDQIQSSRTST
jgi:sirohydrochlorin ferrochelatase